jgi:predicted DNA binding protein
VIRSEAGEMTCVLALDDDSPIQGLIRHGVSLQEIAFRSDSEDLNATVQLPSGTSVREYVEDVTAVLDSVELVAKRDESVDGDVRGMPATVLDGQLTDRQREVLTMAFHAGYFDWPRDNDAVTVATELDIAQSTFSQHLRTAERKLLEGLFA